MRGEIIERGVMLGHIDMQVLPMTAALMAGPACCRQMARAPHVSARSLPPRHIAPSVI